MTRTIDFIFDFGSPNAYLAWKVLPGIADRTGATINLIPCLLGGIFKATGNQAPITAFGGVKGKLEYEALETDRFVQKHGLHAYRFNPHFPVITLIAMRGMIAAQHAGVGDALLAATQTPAVKAELAANTEAAVARGVFGIPTFFVGNEMFFGKERLGQIEELLAAG